MSLQSTAAGRSWSGKILVFLFITIGYLILGSVSLKLATINDHASPIWSPSGFAVGCLLIFGIRYFPAVFLGACLTNFVVSRDITGPVVIGFGNMLEGIAGYYIITFIMKRNLVKNYTEFYAILVAAIFACVASATVAVLYLYLAGIIPPSEADYTWYTWWSGDAIGILIILPFFLEFYRERNWTGFSLKRSLVGLVLTSFLFFITYLVFVKGFNLAFAWTLTPLLILAGFTLGDLLSRAILILVALFTVVLTALGYSPYDYGNMNLNLIYAQSLITSYAFAILFVKPFNTGFKISWKFITGNIVAWATLFLIIFITFKYEKNYTREDLHRTISAAMDSLEQTKNQDEILVNSARSLLSLNPGISASEWREFTETLRLDIRHEEINGLGIVLYLKKSETAKFISGIKKRGSPIREIGEVDPEYAGKFSDRFLISFVEPSVNYFAVGFDMGSEMNRRHAAEESKDINQTIATPPIELIKTKKNGFLIFRSVRDTKERFIGWIYAPVDVNIFFTRALREFSHILRVKIFHGDRQVFNMDSYPKDVFKNHSFMVQEPFTLFGTSLRLEMYPTAQFFTRHSGYSAVLALLMNLFMLFITGFLLEQMTFGQRAERLVTERTKELEASKIQLIHSSKMASLGEMASGMAHEINNPLTIILGKIKKITMMMEETKVDNPVINEEMTKMQMTTERIGKIVKGLRTFSRASESDPFEKVPAQAVVQETLDLCLEKFKAKGIDVQVGQIPDVLLNCRPSQVSQVLLNLLNNAYDALVDRPGENWIHVEFNLMAKNMLDISVVDNGKGIDPGLYEKIMEPFFTTKEVGKGTGLGLSIAKGIIEDHGGKITLDRSSKHTRFVIELPYQRA